MNFAFRVLTRETLYNEIDNYYELTHDIDLGHLDWVPIGNGSNPFSGTFNGNGHIISHMYIGAVQVSSEIFSGDGEQIEVDSQYSSRSSSTVATENQLDEVMKSEIESITAELESAAVAAKENARASEYTASENTVVSIDNIDSIETAVSDIQSSIESRQIDPGESERTSYIDEFSLQSDEYYVNAGLFGFIYSGTIANLGVGDSSVIGKNYAGGIAGYSGAGATIENCYFNGTVESASFGYSGGIVGKAEGNISNCYNKGNIGNKASSGFYYLGGIAGSALGYIFDCANSGDIASSEGYMGGIVGIFLGGRMITGCFNSGNVGTSDTEWSYVGGIVGRTVDGYVSGSANHGKISSTSSSSTSGFTGGIAGYAYIIVRSYNTGNVSGGWSSGMAGILLGGALKNYTAGNVSGTYASAITCLLETNASLGINSNFWALYSAPRAIYADAAYPYGGSAVRVASSTMKSTYWIENTLKLPFTPDIGRINDEYAILEDVDYNPKFTEIETISGNFYFSSYQLEDTPQEKDDYSALFYYNDEYFSQGASVYNPSLATMSQCLVMSAFGSNADGENGELDYSEKSKNAEDLLSDIGFGEIEVNDFFLSKPEMNSFGVIVGYKDIEVQGRTKTLIVLAGRGGSYEVEWGGNFLVGESGDHDGFTTARDIAYDFLSDYIDRHKDDEGFHDEVLFWFAGYSRAAAVVNLLAGKMTTNLSIEGIEYDAEDQYTYCLAAPMGAIENYNVESLYGKYTNIHNILNPCDFVTKVAPESWGFSRYGVDESVIPNQQTTSNSQDFESMYSKLQTLDTEWAKELFVGNDYEQEFKLNTFQYKVVDYYEEDEFGQDQWNPSVVDGDMTMSQFLDSLMTTLAIGLGGREAYAQQLEDAVSVVAAQALGNVQDANKWKAVPACVGEIFSEHYTDIVYELIFIGYDEAIDLAFDYLVDGLLDAGIDIHDEYYESLTPVTLSQALNVIIRTSIASILVSGGSDLVTLFYNAELLKLAHYPELYLAWLQTYDPNY